ncbi:Helicase [Klebsormidium nitens]|uniref:Regulator of telomere elongation helicase 1 homolog n=1 Tax=Klebsormidium nitens TaxID=105231 RepID=A0A1Y1HMY1_KLENI|nr:Helicase [Klebsormidium nitens]|eukprot:GAQ79984.1 Helicase [Klebsormidium nitens]
MPVYTLRGVQVDFPFSAYDCQLVYMERVIQALQTGQNALLESPTGTGKTLCLLCATLAWRESLKTANKPQPPNPQGPPVQAAGNWQPQSSALPLTSGEAFTGGFLSQVSNPNTISALPTIVYSSRTHSQLQQVIKELKNTNYRPKSTILGSREQLCVHHDISKLRGVAQNTTCRATVQARGCRHNVEIESFLHGNPDFGAEPLDIEDLVTIGREIGPCPYYLSRELMAAGAEILFMPYNYLIDKKHRETLKGVNWANTVLIFDEAHNLEGICADAASFDLPALHLTQCITEAGRCVELASQASASGFAGGGTSASAENFLTLKHLLLKLEDKIREVPLAGADGFTRPGPWLLEFLGELNINYETAGLLMDTIDEATALLADDAADKGARSGARQTSYRLSTLAEALRKAFTTEDSMLGPGQTPGGSSSSYRVHIHEGGGPPGRANRAVGGSPQRTLSYWCFDPGTCFREFARLGVRSVVVTSGTLAPLESFAHELKLPFQIRLENPHVIQPRQVWAGVVPVGPSGKALNSSYRTRDSPEYKSELGNAIVNFARIVPNGLLVFFPSYHLLTSCLEFWQTPAPGAATTIWERITRHKQPVVEPREAALFNQANEDFYAKLEDSAASGAVFFAVCRGKVSEGLDFADKAGRAVIITGMPYAMKLDPKIRLKMEFLDDNARAPGAASSGQKALSGDQWYVQLATRAVNQAVGRVIRHRNDYGAIILCDERFGQNNMQNQLSLWLRPYLRRHSKFGEALFTLTQFFRDQAATAVPVAPRAETGPSFGGAKKRLRSEEEGLEVGLEEGANGRRARPHIEMSFEELAGNAGFTNGGVPGSPSAPDSSSRPGGILAILAANKPDQPGGSYRALKEQKKGSLSALLAANRAQAEVQIPLPAGVMLSEATITAANAAIGSMAGIVRADKREGVRGVSGGASAEKGTDLVVGSGSEKEIGLVEASGSKEERISSRNQGEARGDELRDGGLGQSGSGRKSVALDPSLGTTGRHESGNTGSMPSSTAAEKERSGVGRNASGRSDRNYQSGDKSRGEEVAGGGNRGGEAGTSQGAELTTAQDAHTKEMKKRANAMEFLKQVKSELDAADFERFRTLLTDFKKGSTSTETLLDGVVPLFAAKHRWKLLAGFATIVKPADRPLLQRKIDAEKRRRGMSDGAQTPGPSQNGPRSHSTQQRSTGGGASFGRSQGNESPAEGAFQRPTDGYSAPGQRVTSSAGGKALAKSEPRNSVDNAAEVQIGRKCASCQKRPPEKAFKAACGHICCYACWLRIVERTKMCPTCGGRVHKAALEKLYF